MAFRNKLEARCGKELPDFDYEPFRLRYTLDCQYLPDFVCAKTKRIVEAKGLFDAADRRKMLAVKAQHPGWSIEIWFQNPNAKITKRSKTTYAMWCEKNGIAWRQAPIA